MEYEQYDMCVSLKVSDRFLMDLYLVFVPSAEFMILILLIWLIGHLKQRPVLEVEYLEPEMVVPEVLII